MIGTRIEMAGVEYLVPPLTLGQLRRLEPQIRLIINISPDALGISGEEIGAIGDIVSTALSRNYPDMTPDKVLDLLDVSNARDVILAVLTGSGGLRQGEAKAVAKANGAMSMASSPPPADTLTQ